MKLSLVIGTALVSAVMFQMPSTPPMKMGLWNMDVQVKMNIPNMPAAMAGIGNRTTHVKTCMTQESYQKNLSAWNQQKDCTRSNEVWTAKGYSFDISCSKGKTTGHMEMVYDSPDSGHGTQHMDMSGGHGGATSDSVVTMNYLGADCGSVTPDKPVISR